MILTNNINADELFRRIVDALDTDASRRGRIIHETLVILCSAALKHEGQAYGNLFSQLSALCRACNIKPSDERDIQTMRRNSNALTPISDEGFGYDCRALALLISAVTGESIPSYLVGRIPTEGRSIKEPHHKNAYDYLRCIVAETPSPGDGTISVEADSDGTSERLRVSLNNDILPHTYLARMVKKGSQLNLIDCTADAEGMLTPRYIVLEPDFLIDISVLASCFEDFGHHPLLYTLNRMKPRANSQAILLGGFAGRALDDIINNPLHDFRQTLCDSFRDKAMEFATCADFNADVFKALAKQQTANIEAAVESLFTKDNREKALLEPSFVCEKLGIQGRVDLMTTDKRLQIGRASCRERV